MAEPVANTDAGRGSTLVSVAVMGAFAASMAYNLWVLGSEPIDWLIVPAVFVGWYVADFFSGTTHMYLDYRECPAGIGLDRLFHYEGSRASPEYAALHRAAMTRMKRPLDRLTFEFKVHHPRPDALGRRPLIRQIRTTVMFVTLPWSLALNLIAATPPAPPAWAMAFALTVILGTSFAQYFHGALHRDDNPWPIRLMRRLRLLMTPEAHAVHHATLRQDFATNSGWANPVLNVVFNALRRRGWLRDEGLEPR